MISHTLCMCMCLLTHFSYPLMFKSIPTFTPIKKNHLHVSTSLSSSSLDNVFAQDDVRLSVSQDESCSSLLAPGSAKLDTAWEDLGFEYRTTRSHLKMTFSTATNAWSKPVLVKEPYVSVHIGATALHYGQSCFEGLKAFQHQDGSVNLFRPKDNAQRLKSSCERVCMPFPSETQFVDAVQTVVRDNIDYVPPYGTNGALYVRPLLFGSGEKIGLSPADEYTFLIMVIPVGDYYKGGIKPVSAVVITDFDRAAPKGVGGVKVAGNYASDLLPNQMGKKKGFPIGLYLDAQTNSFIEEFSTSNFVGIVNAKDGGLQGGKYVTPKSPSVLPSITNKSLMTIAEDEGMKVEQRPISVSELAVFDEVVACGTAVVVTSVGKVVKGGDIYDFCDEVPGTTTMRLYDRVRAIQVGDEKDKFGWNVAVC